MKKFKIFFIAFLLLNTTVIFGQKAMSRSIGNTQNTSNKQPVSKAMIFHQAKPITNESGFFIQIISTDEPLDKTHAVFQEFGNLKVRVNEETDYTYLIGNFKTAVAAQKFLENIIINRYAKAEVIGLREGELIH